MRATTRRRLAGHVVAVLVALALAACAFVFRFNTLGGTLGFDNDEFATLTRVDLLLHGEQPLRDFADGELRAVWPSLSYELPAWVQRRSSPDLLGYARLTVGTLALCAGGVFLLARAVSRSWVVALLAAAVAIASQPNSYNYPKVLTLTVGSAAIWWALRRPTVASLGALAAWTVVAGLFRHDYAIYVGIGVVAGIIALEPRPWTVPGRRLGIYAGLAALFALPSLIWVERYAGILKYLADTVVSSRNEGNTRRLGAWPVVDLNMPFAADSLTSFNYYAFWAMPWLAAALLAVVAVRRFVRPFDSAQGGPLHGPPGAEARWAAMGVALVAMTVAVNYFFLRSNLLARFGDASVPVVMLASWLAGTVPTLAHDSARARAAAPAVLLALMLAAFVRATDVQGQLETAGITTSPAATLAVMRQVEQRLRSLPPTAWPIKESEGALAVSRYLAECTEPDDRVLMGAYADEVPYFARRMFAGGQGYFAFGFLKSDDDQQLALERVGRQSVPIVLTDDDYEGEFAQDYPRIARHVAEHYREVGSVESHGEAFLRVFVETARQVHRTDPVLGFPCYR